MRIVIRSVGEITATGGIGIFMTKKVYFKYDHWDRTFCDQVKITDMLT